MLKRIKNAKPEELDELLQALLARYREVYPHWDLTLISIDRRESREKQIDKIKGLLDKME